MFVLAFPARRPVFTLRWECLHTVSGLAYAAWIFFELPSDVSIRLSYDAVLLLIVLVLRLIVVPRVIVARTQRYAEPAGRG